MHSFHLVPILCQNSAIKRLKHSPKVSAGKKVPVQSIGLTGTSQENPDAESFEDEWGVTHHYFNDWDKDLDFECPEGEFVHKIRSAYDTEDITYSTHDRQWWYDCHGSKFGQMTDDTNDFQSKNIMPIYIVMAFHEKSTS